MIKPTEFSFRNWCELFVVLFWIALFAILVPQAFAQEMRPNLCRAPYFLDHAKFRYDEYKKSMEGVGPHMLVWLWDTANENPINSVKELKNPLVSSVEVILANENCTKYGPNGRCGQYELFAGMSTDKLAKLIRKQDAKLKNATQAQAKNMCSFVNANLPAGKPKYLSPLLETNLKRSEFTTFANWVKEVPECSDWIFVWNPMGGSPGAPQPPATVSEGHGPNPKFVDNNCIANLDGSIPDDKDYVSWIQAEGQCLGACAWGPNDNCIFEGQTGFIDPRKRTCKEVRDFKMIGAAMREAAAPIIPPPPWSADDELGKEGCVSINNTSDKDGGFIWKQSHVPGYKGVVLFPARFGKFDKVVIRKGKNKVGKVEYAPGAGFPDQSAGNRKRPIWRTNINLKNYPFNVVIRGQLKKPVKDAKGKVVAKAGMHCWPLSNPRIRND